ncbi:unnamed protein product [Fraxinus pennsylvanica]|uniref:Dienelactone hydrolase domain-containing protein n=1 Tax=Fraxinus pennsylvanica TaxID=56036 RepID=A0AAD2DGE5_9LAMI|nr:unnamed protein product [Fraxinus pennsylvanica]
MGIWEAFLNWLRRKLADKVAASGFLVVVFHFYYGDPFDPDSHGLEPQSWMKAHPTAVISTVKSNGVSVVGTGGFCWGGMVVVKLAKFDCIKAAVVLNPGPITEEEINEVKCLIALLGAEINQFTSAIEDDDDDVDLFEESSPGSLMECLTDPFRIDRIGTEVVTWENHGKHDLFE